MVSRAGELAEIPRIDSHQNNETMELRLISEMFQTTYRGVVNKAD